MCVGVCRGTARWLHKSNTFSQNNNATTGLQARPSAVILIKIRNPSSQIKRHRQRRWSLSYERQHSHSNRRGHSGTPPKGPPYWRRHHRGSSSGGKGMSSFRSPHEDTPVWVNPSGSTYGRSQTHRGRPSGGRGRSSWRSPYGAIDTTLFYGENLRPSFRGIYSLLRPV